MIASYDIMQWPQAMNIINYAPFTFIHKLSIQVNNNIAYSVQQ